MSYTKHMKKQFITLLLLVLGIVFCITAPHNVQAQDTLYIVTTTAQVGDVIKNITGNLARVDYIMGSGIDPHLYQPTRSDMSKLMKANMIFYNGMRLEGRMEETLHQFAATKPTVPIADNLPQNYLRTMEGNDTYNYDPHIWMNVKNWISAAQIITKQLCIYDRPSCDTFTKNSDSYITKLQALDTSITQRFAQIPKDKRILITAHDAFGYLGAAYDIEVIGIQGISTQSEAGLKRIAQVIDLLVERNIPAVFVETSVSDQNIKAIIEGAAARGHRVNIGGTLFSDAMGQDDTPEGTYIGMMEHNANVIAGALLMKAEETSQ